MNGFDSVHLAIERLSTDAAGSHWLETAGAYEGRPLGLLIALHPATPAGALQLVTAGEASCPLLARLLGLTGGPNPRRVGFSQSFGTVPVEGDPRTMLTRCVTLRVFDRGNRPHPEIYLRVDLPARKLELCIQDPRAVATLALPRQAELMK
ncbi:MAG TPA: hypothetical protein VJU18_03655 [Vicinamibacteria bacterium]|nr:hypothetical protein [Vicinamibacteria bacterium]